MPDADDLQRLRDAAVVAVLRADSAAAAVAAADALAAGGMRALELTYTTPDAATAIREVRARHGADVLVGAGTIRTVAQVHESVEAGADFLVTPHLDPAVLGAMVASGRLALPGVFTPSEVATALDAGAPAVKLFPASTAGLGHLRALRGPFPGLEVVPTGGIGVGEVRAWLDAGAVAVGAGGELCPSALVRSGDWEALAATARAFLAEAVGA
jgi:2-dehydro-3-deoxyphosphogluconate aldolase / (4S)-4-hydroxy-2-oxoglutarate aldolase